MFFCFMHWLAYACRGRVGGLAEITLLRCGKQEAAGKVARGRTISSRLNNQHNLTQVGDASGSERMTQVCAITPRGTGAALALGLGRRGCAPRAGMSSVTRLNPTPSGS
eukprot:217254-Prymnesium_polylepis.2